MKKIFFLLSLIILLINVNGQTLIGPVAEKLLMKAIPGFVKNERYVLTKQVAKSLTKHYPTYNNYWIPGNEIELRTDGLHYYDAKSYPPLSTAPMETTETSTELRDAANILNKNPEALRKLGKNLTLNTEPLIKKRGNFQVGAIQRLLKLLGYNIDDDGQWGDITQQAIDQALGVDCSGIERTALIKLLTAKVRQRRALESVKYTIRITYKGKTSEDYRLSAKEINTKLGTFNCGINEVCASLEDAPGGSIQYSCKDPMGNEVVITISTDELEVELKLKSPEGGSANLSLNSDGKIEIKSSDGKRMSGATLNSAN